MNQEILRANEAAQAPADELSAETAAARALIANMRDTFGDDEELLADMIEGETGFFEALQRAVDRIGECEALAEGLGGFIKKMQERKSRLEEQGENLRTAVSVAMDQVKLKSRELPNATLSLRDKAREPVISDESLIPSEYWVPQDPRLDKKAIRAAAKDGKEIPGVTLDNGGVSLTIRRS